MTVLGLGQMHGHVELYLAHHLQYIGIDRGGFLELAPGLSAQLARLP